MTERRINDMNGARLRALRKNVLDMPLQAAADLIGIHLSTYKRLENGESEIKPERQRLIIRAFGLPENHAFYLDQIDNAATLLRLEMTKK